MINKNLPAKPISAKNLLLLTISQAKEQNKPKTYHKPLRARARQLVAKLKLKPFFENLLFLKDRYHHYKISQTHKMFALDFVDYAIRKNPQLPLSLFPKKDHPKIIKFLRNKFLIAFFDSINWQAKTYKKQPKTRLAIKYLKDKRKYKNKTVIDCGAFTGATTLALNQNLKPAKIISIEPDPANFQNLLKNLKKNRLKNAIPLKTAVSNRQSASYLFRKGTSMAYLGEKSPSAAKVPTATIDQLVKKLNLKKIKLIKMDIEGSELAAVKGAVKTIKAYKPTLIISLYHKGQDFFEIPPLLKKLAPSYCFRFVDVNYQTPDTEKELIAQA